MIYLVMKTKIGVNECINCLLGSLHLSENIWFVFEWSKRCICHRFGVIVQYFRERYWETLFTVEK